jgi:hypothetical protein
MQTAGLSDRELATDSVGLGKPNSHASISGPYLSDHLRFSPADSIALLAASVAAPRSWSSTNFLNCQE